MVWALWNLPDDNEVISGTFCFVLAQGYSGEEQLTLRVVAILD